jgi:GNAT superfamily N-acetyltransferase
MGGTVTAADDELLELAEDAWSHYPASGGIVRADVGDAVLLHIANPSPQGGWVYRPRLSEADADRRIDEIRAWFAAQGRARFCWAVGAHATPGDLAERLVARGAVPDPDEPISTPMVLDSPPPAKIRPGIVVRRVETFDDFRKALVVSHDAWGEDDEFRLAELRNARTKWAGLEGSDEHWTYLALHDGVAVGYGTLARLDAPAFLLGNAGVVPEARGLGVYSALIRARWDDAVHRGAKALVINAGDMSMPLLARFGLRSGPPIRIYIDASGLAPADRPEDDPGA